MVFENTVVFLKPIFQPTRRGCLHMNKWKVKKFTFTWKELHPPEWEHSDHSVEHKPSWSHQWNHRTLGLSLSSASALYTEDRPTVAANSRFCLDTQLIIFIQYNTCSLNSVKQEYWNQSILIIVVTFSILVCGFGD